MNLFRISLCLLVCALSQQISGEIYGAYFNDDNDGVLLFQTATIDPKTGKFGPPLTLLTEASDLFWTTLNVATRDTKRNIYYCNFGTDALIYAVDVAKQQIRGLIDFGAQEIDGLHYDSVRDELLVLGTFEKSLVLVALPQNGQHYLVFNFTKEGSGKYDLLDFYAQTLNEKTGTFYFVWATSEKPELAKFYLSSFIVTNTSRAVVTTPVSCGNLIVGQLFHDPSGKLFATAYTVDGSRNRVVEFSGTSNTCTSVFDIPLKSDDDVEVATYDPTTGYLYWGTVNQGFYTYDVAKRQIVTKTNTTYELANIHA